MWKKRMLREALKREHEYLAKQEVGSPEYCASQKRMMDLEKAMKDLSTGDATWERIFKIVLETVKVVGSIAIPVFGTLLIIASEKDITFTGVLRELPKEVAMLWKKIMK